MRKYAALLLALGLAGCGTLSWNPIDWFRAETAHKPTPLAEIRATVTPRAAWMASVGKSPAFRFRPDVEGGKVYAASADGTIAEIDLESGRVAARHETKKRLSGGVEAGEGKIVAGTLKGEVVALDESGREAWSTSVGGEVIAPPAISRKIAVVRTTDGRIFGLNTDNGKRLWVFQRPAPSLLLRSEAGVLAVGGDVVAGYSNGKLIALDLDDGSLTWEVTVSPPRGATELERIADIAGLPVIDGSRICASAYQGKTACFEIQSRNMAWARDLSSSRSIAVDAKRLYVVDDASNVHALDKASGASIWKQDKLMYRRLSSPVFAEGHLLVGDGFGYLHVLSSEDGSLVGRLATDGTAVSAIVPVIGGVVLQTVGGTVALVKF